jgi:hypothetical protein
MVKLCLMTHILSKLMAATPRIPSVYPKRQGPTCSQKEQLNDGMIGRQWEEGSQRDVGSLNTAVREKTPRLNLFNHAETVNLSRHPFRPSNH